MQPDPLGAVVRHLHRLADGRATAELTDGQLLEGYVVRREPAALEALVERHGPLVLGVCRRVLGRRPEADDAFQAAFLILVRKASSLDRRGSLGPWLYTVAYRLAVRARSASRRLPPAPAGLEPVAAADPLGELTGRELCCVLDEELRRLPEKFRAPLVLCCLEGRARDEAAQALGWTLGTLKGRLERGRDLLRRRLGRRGIDLPAALLAATTAALAAVPDALARDTVTAASNPLAGTAARLAEGVLRTIFLTKLTTTAGLLLSVCAAGLVACHFLLATPTAPAPPGSATNVPGRAVDVGPRRDGLGDLLPPGALARLGTERFRHTHTVRSVAYSPDGKLLVSASWDRTVRLWEVATGKELRRFPVPGGGSGAAVSPDGRLVVSGDMDSTLIFWDATTGKELGRTGKLENTIFFIRFSPDGRTVAAASGDALRVYDTATRKERYRLDPPRGGVQPIRFSPDSKALAAGCADGTIRLWDVTTGKESLRLPGHQGRPWTFTFTAGGKRLVSVGGPKDRTVRVWDAATGNQVNRLADLPDGFAREPARAIVGPAQPPREAHVFAFDGRTLAAGGDDGRVFLWDVQAGRSRGMLLVPGQDDERGPWVMGLALSPDGKTLAVGTTGKAITFWDVATRKEQPAYPGHRDAVTALAFLAGGKELASAGSDAALCFWTIGPGQERHRIAGAHRESVTALAALPDGRSLVSAGGDGKVRLWDTSTCKEVRHWVLHQGPVDDVAVSPDGKSIAAGGWRSHTIRLWDVAGQERVTIRLPPSGNYGNLPLAFSGDGKVLASGSGDRTNNVLLLWDTRTGKELLRIPERVGGRGSLAFLRDGRLAVAGGKTIRLYDATTGSRAGSLDGDDDAGTCIANSPDGRLLAAGGGPDQPTVRVWEIASGKLVGKRRGHKGWIRAITFSPDGRRLASGSEDSTVLVWDVRAFAAAGTPGASLDALWEDLRHEDAARARRAVWSLAGDPARSVPSLARRLRPVEAPDTARLTRLVRDLDHDAFAVREQATRDLQALGEGAAPALRTALGQEPTPELKKRAERLLKKLRGVPGPEELRARRAVEVLEHAGTPEARRVLAALAKGWPQARLTQEARAALRRLGQL
jgi:RNA polymerase sigma factor (sigma-70 family)